MMRCKDIQKQLEDFLNNDMDDLKRKEIQSHLDECQNCSRLLRELTRLSGVLQTWKEIEPSPLMYEKLKTRMKSYKPSWQRILTCSFAKKVAFRFAEVAAIVVLTLSVSHLIQKPPQKAYDDSATINFYLMEHQGAITQTASTELSTRPAARAYMSRDDILYYEFIDELPRSARPGIILRRPSSQREISPAKAPAISKRKILTLPQARNAVDFDPVMLPRLHPGYILDSLRKIDDYHSLHMLYTNGIDTISLFEQPSNGEQGLAAQDFREYAVFRNVEPATVLNGQGRATILAWSSGAVSFVLIGKTDMAQLMDMAQSISNTKIKITNNMNNL